MIFSHHRSPEGPKGADFLHSGLIEGTMQLKKTFLIGAFVAVTIIALLYGVSPTWFAPPFWASPI